MGDYVLIVGAIIGVPVYLYVIVRILTSGIFRSYYEVKNEHLNKNKKQEVV